MVTENLGPYQTVQPDGTVGGIHTDVIADVFTTAKVPFNIYINEWSVSFQQALHTPNVCIYSIARTPEREPQFEWIGYLSSMEGYFYSKAERNIQLEHFSDAFNYKVAAIKNDVSTQHLLNKGFVKDDNLYEVDSYASLLSLLEVRSDSIDLIMLGDALLSSRVTDITQRQRFKKHDAFTAINIDFYLACNKHSDPALTHALSDVFSRRQQ